MVLIFSFWFTVFFHLTTCQDPTYNNGQYNPSWTTQYYPTTNAYGNVVTITSIVPCPTSTTVVYSTEPCNQGCYSTPTSTWYPSPTTTWYPQPTTTWYPTTSTTYWQAPPPTPATTYAQPITTMSYAAAPQPTTLQTIVVVVESGGVMMTMTSTQGMGQVAAVTATTVNAAATKWPGKENLAEMIVVVGAVGGMWMME